MVKNQVDLLGSDVESDIFLAGTLLMEQVEFLSNYTINAHQIMNPSIEYDMQAIEDRINNSLTF